MHPRVSENIFFYTAFVLFTQFAMTSDENMRFSFQTSLLFFQTFIIKSLIQRKLVNFFLAFQNITFIGREWVAAQIFRVDGWKYRDIVGKMSFFFLKHLNFPNFLWMLVHFIAVIYFILNLTDSFRKDW